MTDTGKFTILPDRGIVAVSGADRFSFLQGLITNDIEKIKNGGVIYACLLTPQGKFLFDFFVLEYEEQIFLECQLDKAESLTQNLKKFKLRSDVDFQILIEKFSYITLYNKETVENIDLNIFYTDPRREELGGRLIVKKAELDAAKSKLTQLGFTENPFEDYDLHRLELGVPDGSRDMIEQQSTMIECNLDRLNAIDWDKGCYMGQELTARMHYRGLAKKRLFPVRITGAAPASGTEIFSDGKRVGEMRSHCKDRGLALLKIDAVESGQPLTAGEARLQVLS